MCIQNVARELKFDLLFVFVSLILSVKMSHGQSPASAALIIGRGQASNVHAYTGVATIWSTVAVLPRPRAVTGGPGTASAVACNCDTVGVVACNCAIAAATVAMAPDDTLILHQGACGYGPLFANSSQGYNFGGLPTRHPLSLTTSQHGCGICLEVACDREVNPKGACNPSLASIMITVVDSCGGSCIGTDINLPRRAYQTLGALSLGHVIVTYHQVPCMPTGGIIVHVDLYRVSEGGYIRLSFKNVAGLGGFSQVGLATTGGQEFRNMTNVYGAQWELSRLPPLPFDLLVTDTAGNQLTIVSAISSANVVGDIQSGFQI